MNKLNIFEYKDPTFLSIFVSIVTAIGMVFFLFWPSSQYPQITLIYRWILTGVLFFWLERVYTNTWVFDKTCLKSQPKQMAILVLIPYLQLLIPTRTLIPVWQCSDKNVSERGWQSARPSILLHFLGISIILTAMIHYLNVRFSEFINNLFDGGSYLLSYYFIPWCISFCLLLGIIMVWKLNQRQIAKYQQLISLNNGDENISVILTDEDITELSKVTPIPVEEPIPGITDAKKNLKGSFISMSISIWLHVITLVLIVISLFFNSLSTSTGEGAIFVYMLSLQLIFFSLIWIYTTHSVNNAFEILEKPIRPLYTFVWLLIPFVNLIFPTLKMMQIWKVSDIESTRENWRKASPSIVLIINWLLLFVFSVLLIKATGKNFMLSDQENMIISLVEICLLSTIIIFMFQLKARQKAKAIQLNLLPEKIKQQVHSSEIEATFFHNLD